LTAEGSGKLQASRRQTYFDFFLLGISGETNAVQGNGRRRKVR
jgi:hypothetical protein